MRLKRHNNREQQDIFTVQVMGLKTTSDECGHDVTTIEAASAWLIDEGERQLDGVVGGKARSRVVVLQSVRWDWLVCSGALLIDSV